VDLRKEAVASVWKRKVLYMATIKMYGDKEVRQKYLC
jgi:hypothetical protein